jgi:hypothetical protein
LATFQDFNDVVAALKRLSYIDSETRRLAISRAALQKLRVLAAENTLSLASGDITYLAARGAREDVM